MRPELQPPLLHDSPSSFNEKDSHEHRQPATARAKNIVFAALTNIEPRRRHAHVANMGRPRFVISVTYGVPALHTRVTGGWALFLRIRRILRVFALLSWQRSKRPPPIIIL